jgi:tetratricopeptide (TPR) repeat protein
LRLSLLIFLSVLPGLLHCQKISDSIRNWGTQSRRNRAKALQEEELKMWERDLSLSRARAQELQRTIHSLVQESAHQGALSWKIARAYMNNNRFEEAIPYYEGAMNNTLPEPASSFEEAIPYFNIALRKNRIDTDLLFEAGLCYANASRSAGWEKSRWKTAVQLFDLMRAQKPEDRRAHYQLALLYGKAGRAELRNVELAKQLLKEILAHEDMNIPAYFTLAHIEAESGDLAAALSSYRRVQEKLEELNKKGVLGDLERNRQYQKAAENIEKLTVCVNRQPGCEISQP